MQENLQVCYACIQASLPHVWAPTMAAFEGNLQPQNTQKQTCVWSASLEVVRIYVHMGAACQTEHSFAGICDL